MTVNAMITKQPARGSAISRRAFTLVEVVLAITLALAATTAVLVFYRQTGQIRASVMEDVHVVSSQRLVMQRMTDELRGSMVYPFLGMGMQGRTDQVRFFTATTPGRSAWAMRSPTDDTIPLEADQDLVGYRLRVATDDQGQPLKDDSGNVIVLGLERTSQKVLTTTAEEGKEITVVFLTPHIKFLMLRYWDGSSWVSAWSGSDLPLGVEITLRAEPLLADEAPEEYSHDFLRRVVYLPGGTKALGGTIIRGLGSGAGGSP